MTTLDESDRVAAIRRVAARAGIAIRDAPTPSEVNSVVYGHSLPAEFVWFCRHCPAHVDFPYASSFPGYGLLSPLGQSSPLLARNRQVREWHIDWPAKWVSFWTGADGDYCFSFEPDGQAWVVYWYYNYEYHDETKHLEFADDYKAVDFVEWFAEQVEWASSRR